MDDALFHSRKFKYNVHVIEKKHKQHNTITKMQCTSVFEMYLARFLHSDLFYSMTHAMEDQTYYLSIFFFFLFLQKNDINLKPNHEKLHEGEKNIGKQII